MRATLSQAVDEFNKLNNSAINFDKSLTSIITKTDKLGNVTKITGTMKALNDQTSKVKVSMNSAGEIISKTFTQTEKSSGSLKNTLSTMFNVNKLYLYWNLTKRLRTAISGAYNSAVDYIETQNKFNVSMGSAKPQAVKFVNQMSEAIGIAKSELMDYQSTYKNILSGLGNFTDNQSEKISESLTKMALDYSSLFNVSQSDAMNKFQSALTGSIRPIRSDSGYDVSDTTIGAKAQELGIDRSVNKLNQMEKRILRIIVLMDQLRNTGAMGDLARTIEQPASQMRVLKAQIQEVGVWIGNVFMGTVGKVLPYINAFVMVIKELIKMLAIFTGYTGDNTNLSDVFESVENSTGGVSNNLGNASKKAKELRKYLMGFDVLNVINKPTDTGKSSSSGGGLGTIDPKILGALGDYNSMMEKVRMKATDIRDKIMEWLGFTKVIDPLTGEVSWKLRDGYQNIEKIRDILLLIGGTILAVKIFNAIKNISNALAWIKGTKLVSWFANFSKSVGSATTAGAKFSTIWTKALSPLLKVVSVIGGLVLAIKGASTITKEYNKILEGQATNQWNVAKGMAEMVAGGALIGSVFGPWGAVIGGVVGALAGLVVNIYESKKVLTELAESQLFGNLSISTESWKKQLESIDGLNFGTTVEELQSKIATLSEEFEIASAKVEGYGLRFGVMGEKLKNEDIVNIKSAVSDMCTSTTEMIDANTNAQMSLWSNTYKTLGNISKEEQKDWLETIQNYGKSQKKEISTAQNNITNTYNKAIKTRGYLTDEEYDYIQKQLAKIRKLTQQNMSQSNTDMIYLKNKFVQDSTKLDEQSYKNYKEAQEQYRKEQYDAISKDYSSQYNALKTMLDNKAISQQDYNKKIEQLNQQRTKNEETVNNTIKKANQDVYNSLIESYDKIKNKTDTNSKYQKKVLEELFDDLDVDPSNFITQMEKAGRTGNEKLLKKVKEKKLDPSDLIGTKTDWAKKGSSLSGAFWSNWSTGKVSVSTTDDGGAKLRVQPYKMKADGGPVAVGEMFIAREAGPELVGKIGNTTTVMNNQQIVQAVSQGVAQAVASVMGNRNTGDIRVIVDGRELASIIEERMLRNQNIYGIA